MAAGIKVKLVGSMSGHEESHRATLRGLGLTRVGKERVVQDNKETRGMINKVSYLLEVTETKEEFKPFGRRQAIKKARAASAARSKG